MSDTVAAQDIQRYGAKGPLSNPPGLGEYVVVTYNDHVDAVTAAVADAVHQKDVETFPRCKQHMDDAFDRGFAEARDEALVDAKAREVNGLTWTQARHDAAQDAISAVGYIHVASDRFVPWREQMISKGDAVDAIKRATATP